MLYLEISLAVLAFLAVFVGIWSEKPVDKPLSRMAISALAIALTICSVSIALLFQQHREQVQQDHRLEAILQENTDLRKSEEEALEKLAELNATMDTILQELQEIKELTDDVQELYPVDGVQAMSGDAGHLLWQQVQERIAALEKQLLEVQR